MKTISDIKNCLTFQGHSPERRLMDGLAQIQALERYSPNATICFLTEDEVSLIKRGSSLIEENRKLRDALLTCQSAQQTIKVALDMAGFESDEP